MWRVAQSSIGRTLSVTIVLHIIVATQHETNHEVKFTPEIKDTHFYKVFPNGNH